MQEIQYESMTDLPALREGGSRDQVTEERAPVDVDPVRGDPFMTLARRLLGLRPGWIAALFFVLQYGTVWTVLYLTGTKHGTDPIKETLRFTSVDHLNLAVLVPLGAAMLCHLYRQIQATFHAVQHKRLVRRDDREQLAKLLHWAQRRYRSPWALVACVALSVSINTLFLVKGQPLFSVDLLAKLDAGTISAPSVAALIYARLWVVLNYTVIFLLFHRATITVWLLYRTTELDLRIEPMHPDRAGGLNSLGELSVAVMSVLSLVMVFLAVTPIFGDTRVPEIYVALLFAFAGLNVFGFFGSLSPAHAKMRRVKTRALEQLEVIAQRQFKRFNDYSADAGPHGAGSPNADRELIEEMNAVDQLYGVVQKMPVWPFDFSLLGRFVTTIALPVLIFVLDRARFFDWIASAFD